MNSWIIEGNLLRRARTNYGGVSSMNLFSGFAYDMLLYGTDVDSASTLGIESILRPFSIPVWILLLVSICVATLVVLLTTGTIDVTGYVIGMLTPLLAQVTLRINPEGKERKAFGTFDGLYSAWILLTVYISSIYLGMLQSLKISPQVQTVNTSFNEMVAAGFAFHTHPDIFDRYEQIYLGRWSMFHMGIMSKRDFEDHSLLASLLHPMALGNMTSKFLELDRVVWLEDKDDIEALRDLLTPALVRSYHILKHRFAYYPLWTIAIVPHGHELMGEYQRLIDSGVTGQSIQLLRRKRFKLELVENVDFSGAGSARKDFSPTDLKDSLILESLFLFGVGIAFSMVVIVVEVVLNAVTFLEI